MTDTIPPSPDSKSTLRAQASRLRGEAASRLGAAAGQALADLAPSLGIAAGSVVAGYWPLGDEIDPLPLMARLARSGCRLALPAVAAPRSALEFRPWGLDRPLEDGPHRTRHPPASAGRVVPDVVLVPLLAFDGRGFRLGYGGGYYDRTLAALRAAGGVVAIGLAFAVQRVASLPLDGWDQPLDMIVTEGGVVTLEQA